MGNVPATRETRAKRQEKIQGRGDRSIHTIKESRDNTRYRRQEQKGKRQKY